MDIEKYRFALFSKGSDESSRLQSVEIDPNDGDKLYLTVSGVGGGGPDSGNGSTGNTSGGSTVLPQTSVSHFPMILLGLLLVSTGAVVRVIGSRPKLNTHTVVVVEPDRELGLEGSSSLGSKI